jgi:hypothetical protein
MHEMRRDRLSDARMQQQAMLKMRKKIHRPMGEESEQGNVQSSPQAFCDEHSVAVMAVFAGKQKIMEAADGQRNRNMPRLFSENHA